MKYYILIKIIFTIILMGLLVIPVDGSVWVSDSSTVSGLTDVGFYSSPTVFTNNSILYLISGNYFGTFNGFNWSGTTWQSDTNIVSGLTSVGTLSSPTVFTNNSILYLISGEEDGIFNGFNWTGTTWQSDSNIVSGLTSVGTVSSPIVFIKDSILYLISGRADGTFSGFNWTGSTWQSDSSIVSGLTDVGSASSPTIFTKDSTLYLISGEDDGTFNGFSWTGTTWQSDSNIVSGLTDVGTFSSPTIFTKDSTLYLISGNSNGLWSGFKFLILLLTSSVSPSEIFKCQAATISASFDDVGITSVNAILTSEKAVQPMIPGSGRTNLETQTTNISMNYNGSYWVGTFGNDQNLLWGNRLITYQVGGTTTYSSSSSVFVYSDACTGTGVVSYQNMTNGIGTYTNMIANSNIDIISWALYPWVQYWGYLFYVLILFTICTVIYLKTENITQVLLIGLALLLLGSTTVFIPPEWQNRVIMLIGLAMAGIYYRVFTRE